MKSEERTEEQKLIQEPLKVTLGGRVYEIKPLPVKYSLPWCKKVAKLTAGGVLSQLNQSSENPEAFETAMYNILAERPAEAIDLFFEYARDLNQDEILETATLTEVLSALDEVKGLESRFFGWSTAGFAKMVPTPG